MLPLSVPIPLSILDLEEAGPAPIYRSELAAALSYALDLTEGQPLGHSVRTCLIGMRLAELLGLPAGVQQDLYYALLLKDLGCSSNAARLTQILGSDEIEAKRDVKTTDWTRIGWESLCYAWRHVLPGRPVQERLSRLWEISRQRVPQQREVVQIRCEQGARIARKMGFSEETASAIRCLDEHWNGKGYPSGRQGEEIPLLSRIMNLSQTMEVYASAYGPPEARDVVYQRKGRWFDPSLVKVAEALFADVRFWQELPGDCSRAYALEVEPLPDCLPMRDTDLDQICGAFSEVIDAKTPYTYRHSVGVAVVAGTIARGMQLDEATRQTIHRAALLHDIGKLSVPNSILDKPGRLAPQEWETVRRHPYYSQKILEHVGGFAEIAQLAGAHHEKLDGSGYWRGLSGAQLPIAARVLAVADMYEALAADRPYRDALAPEQVLQIIRLDVPRALDGRCVESLGSMGNSLRALALASEEGIGKTAAATRLAATA